MNHDLLKKSVASGNVQWKKHVLQRIAERNIRQADVLNGLIFGVIIQEYPDDTPFASALFLCFTEHGPLHIVASLNETNAETHIITAYNPSLERFEEDYKTRKT
ncbi:DUF4258 domain-containing protein [Spirosoma montaniterrae]|uniref:DUF4258 domain-containing protein n=1 Tax=Spirosoma montaniterrae TaxID=1178516 RepID=A0A1P9WSZ5_9BACT|nr:DUF4258 domain-containing protein [Spirosoma montaniterrae]AQG78460.1 hypothetical protein AWR27_03360 [Spirosoma montaniterrae]